MKIIIYILIGILAVGNIASGVMLYNYSNWLGDAKTSELDWRLEATVKAKTITEIEGTNQRLENSLQNLHNQYNSLSSQYSSTKSQLIKTEGDLSSAKTTITETKTEMKEIINTMLGLKSRVEDNAHFNYQLMGDINSEIQNSIGYPLGIYDYVINDGNLGWIIHTDKMGQMMYNPLGFSYSTDSDVSYGRTDDKQYDVYTFWRFRTGDCDDFSNFYAAWLRTTINKYDGAYVVVGDYMYKNPNIYNVCGLTKSGGGHCVVGVGGSPYNLNDMEIIEPQGGKYKGNTFDEFERVWAVFSEDDFYILSDSVVTNSLSESLKNAGKIVINLESEIKWEI